MQGGKAERTSVIVSGSHSSMGSGSASISVAKSATDTVPLMATTMLLVGLSRASMYGKSPTGEEECHVSGVARCVECKLGWRLGHFLYSFILSYHRELFFGLVSE